MLTHRRFVIIMVNIQGLRFRLCDSMLAAKTEINKYWRAWNVWRKIKCCDDSKAHKYEMSFHVIESLVRWFSFRADVS